MRLAYRVAPGAVDGVDRRAARGFQRSSRDGVRSRPGPRHAGGRADRGEDPGRAKYFLAVIDEDPKGGLPEVADGGVESDEERVQRTPHYARVGLWRLSDGKLFSGCAGAPRDVWFPWGTRW